MRVAIDLPEDVRAVEIRKNSPLSLRVTHDDNHVDELLEHGVLLCACCKCETRWLMFSRLGAVRCPSCGGKGRAQWRRMKIGLVPE